MSETCLITGGAGFIGCAVSAGLADHFGRVIVLDSLHPQIHPSRMRPTRLDHRVELAIGDVTEAAIWDDILRNAAPAVILHLAAETGTGQSLTQASRHANVNVLGTAAMLDALARHDCIPRKIVLLSSRAIYGEGAWQNPYTGAITYPGQRSKAQLDRQEWDFPGLSCLPFHASTTQSRPTSIYGATKLAQEHMLGAWALSFGVSLHILRLQNVYGPGQSLSNPYTGIVPLFARLARGKQRIPVFEDGKIVRDFVFIDDVAQAILRVATDDAALTATYDVGSGQKTTIHDLALMIAALYDAPAPHINGNYRNGDVRHAVSDISQTMAKLNWHPRHGIQDGVRALCAWIDLENAPAGQS